MIETRLNLVVVAGPVPGTASIRVSVSQWTDDELTKNSNPFEYVMPVKEFNSAQSVIPWAISTLRGASDVAVADLIHRLGKSEERVMHDCEEHLLF